MTKDPADIPSRGVACCQVYQLMSFHVEWHDEKGSSLYTFTWSGTMTRDPAHIPLRGVAC